MKIKRTFAKDMREAMRLVKLAQGPEAVIISNRKIDGGIEVISALDFDPQLVDEALRSAGVADEDLPKNVYSMPPALTKTVFAPERKSAALTSNLTVEEKVTAYTATHSATIKEGLAADAFADNDHRFEPILGLDNRVSATAATNKSKSAAKPLAQKVEARTVAARPHFLPGMGPNEKEKDIIWAQDPAISDMREEIKLLRSLMENQLSVMSWEKQAKVNPMRTALLHLLTQMDLGRELCQSLADATQNISDPQQAWRHALATLSNQVPIADDEILDGGMIAIVGATGVGKTTTVAKLAARFTMRHGPRDIALISTDNYRIGAHEQLQNFASIMQVPLHAAHSTEELKKVLEHVQDKKLVLIDTAGMSQRDLRLTQQLASLRDSSPLIRCYLTLSANTQLAAMDEVVKSFSKIPLNGCVITKIDEAASLGAVLTTTIRHDLPIAYLGTGQKVPDDLQLARAHRLVSKAVALKKSYAEEIDNDEMAVRFSGTFAGLSA